MKIPEIRWMLRYFGRSFLQEAMAQRGRLREWRRFRQSYRQYQQLAPAHAQPQLDHLFPCLGDNLVETPIEPVYFYQDAWAFEKIAQRNPPEHVDVGSHHMFVALLSKVVPLTMVDIRPLALPLETIKFRRGSITQMPYADGSIRSLSSLCVLEHIGLGRYGDPLDWEGTEKAIAELKRLVAPGGDLYISVPLDDDNRTYFNAHRAFKEEYVLSLLEPFEIVERRYIYGNEFVAEHRQGFGIGCFHVRAPQTMVAAVESLEQPVSKQQRQVFGLEPGKSGRREESRATEKAN
jgi:SAM-dependent methyltransferase